jgi:hypothetical protein
MGFPDIPDNEDWSYAVNGHVLVLDDGESAELAIRCNLRIAPGCRDLSLPCVDGGYFRYETFFPPTDLGLALPRVRLPSAFFFTGLACGF